MEIIKSLAAASIFLMSFGVLSLKKPEIIGADFYWQRYKWFYIPKYKKTENRYYEHMIKVIGIGLILSSLISIVIVLIYTLYPYISLYIFA